MRTADQLAAMPDAERLQLFETLLLAHMGAAPTHQQAAAVLGVHRRTVERWRQGVTSVDVVAVLYLQEITTDAHLRENRSLAALNQTAEALDRVAEALREAAASIRQLRD